MLYFFSVIHLTVFGFMFYMAVKTTDRSILNVPAAVVSCLLWPIVLPVLFIAVQFYPDVPIEEPAVVGGRLDEVERRLLPQD